MTPFTRVLMSIAVLGLVANCGGVNEERVSALEAQLKQLKEGSSATPSGADMGPVQERLGKLEAQTRESVGKLEEMMELLQREVTKMAADKSPAGAAPSSNARLWRDLDQMITGVVAEGVAVEGDTYTVRSEWLASEVHALALSGKAPKLSENKKGGTIVIKGIKPKSLPEKLGLKNNDEIVSVNDKPVTTVADLTAALRAGNDALSVKVTRRKKEVVLQYRLAK